VRGWRRGGAPRVSALALAMVLASAVAHASWNLCAKRAGAAGVEFAWLVAIAGLVLYLPAVVVLVAVSPPDLRVAGVAFMAGSGALHTAYFLLLQKGYRVGDLSVVYPVARGTGPAVSTLAAVAFLGERPSGAALAGGALVVGGLVALAGGSVPDGPGATRARLPVVPAVAYGLATGGVIASYTLWDKHGVDTLAVPPLLYSCGTDLVRTALLTPLAARRRARLRSTWARHRTDVLAVAVLSPLAYILVLTALAVAPVSYVAPAREVSVLVGGGLGVAVLGEPGTLRRLAGAVLVVGGLVALALG
jgi:drug/metabolite transporter (DMT)-like permease